MLNFNLNFKEREKIKGLIPISFEKSQGFGEAGTCRTRNHEAPKRGHVQLKT